MQHNKTNKENFYSNNIGKIPMPKVNFVFPSFFQKLRCYNVKVKEKNKYYPITIVLTVIMFLVGATVNVEASHTDKKMDERIKLHYDKNYWIENDQWATIDLFGDTSYNN